MLSLPGHLATSPFDTPFAAEKGKQEACQRSQKKEIGTDTPYVAQRVSEAAVAELLGVACFYIEATNSYLIDQKEMDRVMREPIFNCIQKRREEAVLESRETPVRSEGIALSLGDDPLLIGTREEPNGPRTDWPHQGQFKGSRHVHGTPTPWYHVNRLDFKNMTGAPLEMTFSLTDRGIEEEVPGEDGTFKAKPLEVNKVLSKKTHSVWIASNAPFRASLELKGGTASQVHDLFITLAPGLHHHETLHVVKKEGSLELGKGSFSKVYNFSEAIDEAVERVPQLETRSPSLAKRLFGRCLPRRSRYEES